MRGEQLPTYLLGEPGPMRDRMVGSVLAGRKTATSWLQVFYEMEGIPLPRAGDRFRLIDSVGQQVGVVETTRADIVRLADVSDDVARAAGEGYADRLEWRAAYVAYWDRYRADVRSFLRDERWSIDDDTSIVVEHFRLRR